jgi:cytochrome c oxidase cbb3-type subunit 2
VRSNFAFFIGLFAALAISWAGIVLGSNAQLGKLAPYYDDASSSTFPEWFPGVASQGQLVYKDLGCVACHTQQVRRPGFGSDKDRGWGDRQSVARDYIYQPFPQLGSSRIGPDLTNLGDRKPSAPDADDLLKLLYTGSGGMPSYRFLFEKREIGVGAQGSDNALKLTGSLKPSAGWEIVPTARAQSLVGYLVSLKTTFTYPEAVPVVPAKPEGEAAKAAPAPAPAAAPAPAPSAPETPAAGATTAPSTAAAPASPVPAASTPSPAASAPAATPAPSACAAAAPAAAATPAPSTAAAPAPTGAAATPAAAPAAGVTPAPSAAAAATPSPTATAPAAQGGTK